MRILMQISNDYKHHLNARAEENVVDTAAGMEMEAA